MLIRRSFSWNETGVVELKIKLVPGASRNEVSGWLGDALKLRVRAAPEKGKANKAMIALLADTLAVPGRQISIVRGHGQATKTVRIGGLDAATLSRRIG